MCLRITEKHAVQRELVEGVEGVSVRCYIFEVAVQIEAETANIPADAGEVRDAGIVVVGRQGQESLG